MSAPDHINVSIVLCLHRAEARVSEMVGELAKVLKDNPQTSFEILAIEEGSVDNTSSLLSLLREQIPQIRALGKVEKNRAIERGAREARGEIWLFVEQSAPSFTWQWMIEALQGEFHAAWLHPDESPYPALAIQRTLGTFLRNFRGNLTDAIQGVASRSRQDSYLRIASAPPDVSGAAFNTPKATLFGRIRGWRKRLLRPPPK